MFLITLVIFIVFTLFFGLLSSAIIYHLRQYTLPGSILPRLAIFLFLFFTILFWLFALYFLLKIPTN